MTNILKNKVFLTFLFLVPLSLLVFTPRVMSGVTDIYYVGANKFLEYVYKKKGKRKLVFIYTSWCPHCRDAFPSIMALEQSKKGSVAAISTDRDHKKLEQYLNKMGRVPFHVFLANQKKDGGFQKMMNRKGINFSGSIPYMAVLDENNKVVSQSNFLDMEEVVKYIKAGS